MPGLLRDPMAWLLGLLYTLPGLVIGLTVHEFCHAAAAVALGDPTPRREGRLTLNPGAHVDGAGLLLFALLGWGYARPVRIVPGNLRGRKWGELAVALSGPLANLALAALLYALWAWMPQGLWTAFLRYGCSINLTLCFLNLLPVPPLDGFAMIRLLIPLKWSRAVFFLQRWGLLVLLALSLLGVLSGYFAVTTSLSMRAFAAVFGV